MSADREGIDNLAYLNWLLGRAKALNELPKLTQTMAWFAIHAGWDYQNSSERAACEDYYEALDKVICYIDGEVKKQLNAIKDHDEGMADQNDLIKHINTLNLSMGYLSVFNDTIESLLWTLEGAFIEMGADNPDLIRGKALMIFEDIECNLKRYGKIIDKLKMSADKKVNKIIGGS